MANPTNMVAHIVAIISGTAPTGNSTSSSSGWSVWNTTMKPWPSSDLPWMPWRLPIVRAMTGSLTFWPPSIMCSHWPTNWEKTNLCLKRASLSHGRCLTGYPWHANTIGQNHKYWEWHEWCNQQHSRHGGAPKLLAWLGGNAEYKALLMDLAQSLGHIINREPNPWLRKLGSIKQADHPKLWWHWFKWVATPNNWPRGVAINSEGFPYPQHISGFRHLMPITHHLRRETISTDEHQWQWWGITKLLCMFAVPWWYKKLLSQHHIIIAPQLSWESIEFHHNMGEAECTWLLDNRGITLDEADDLSQLHLHLDSG